MRWKMEQSQMTNAERKAERAVIKAAMLCWKYEPVSSALVGYSRRWRNMMKACARLAARAAGKKRKRGAA